MNSNIWIQENFFENATNSCSSETPDSIDLNVTRGATVNTDLFKPDPFLYNNLSIVEKETEAEQGEAPMRAQDEAPLGAQGTDSMQAQLRAQGPAIQAPLGTPMPAQGPAFFPPQVPITLSFAQSNKQPASIQIQLPSGQINEIDALFNNISEDNEYFLKIKDSLLGLCSGCSNQCSYNLCLKPIPNNTVDTLFKIQRNPTDSTKINIKNVATDRYLSVCSNCIYMCPNTICSDRINPNLSFTQFIPKINEDNTISFIGPNGNYLQIMEKEYYPSCYIDCDVSGIIASNGTKIDELSKFEIIPILN